MPRKSPATPRQPTGGAPPAAPIAERHEAAWWLQHFLDQGAQAAAAKITYREEPDQLITSVRNLDARLREKDWAPLLAQLTLQAGVDAAYTGAMVQIADQESRLLARLPPGLRRRVLLSDADKEEIAAAERALEWMRGCLDDVGRKRRDRAFGRPFRTVRLTHSADAVRNAIRQFFKAAEDHPDRIALSLIPSSAFDALRARLPGLDTIAETKEQRAGDHAQLIGQRDALALALLYAIRDYRHRARVAVGQSAALFDQALEPLLRQKERRPARKAADSGAAPAEKKAKKAKKGKGAGETPAGGDAAGAGGKTAGAGAPPEAPPPVAPGSGEAVNPEVPPPAPPVGP